MQARLNTSDTLVLPRWVAVLSVLHDQVIKVRGESMYSGHDCVWAND
ncbi:MULTISPECIES: hypothetical protein [Burkholderiaceae]|nr:MULTISPECIES: hypothetical protein [Burkholderiaceae]MCG1039405.1 hypothetical protein [Mycetohabitans sp. B7]SIT64909.1 hypothetical protein SAMN04487769_0126 [Burkholderia sp. b14]